MTLFCRNHQNPSSNDMAATLRYKAEDYTIGWICALTTELTAARSMLDELHDNGRQLPQDASDKNNYVRGQIHGHNIVIARSSAGTTSAAVAAIHMLHTYPNIRFGLLVGIAGGAPRGDEHDIRLGDIVIGMPTKHHGGVVQVDFGTQIGEGVDGFKITGQLDKPPRELVNAVEMLRSNHDFDRPNLQDYISPTTLKKKHPQLVKQYCYSTELKDNLFEATYPHQDEEDKICAKCDEKRVEKRAKRLTLDDNIDTSPRLHYGNIASANRVMRYAKARDDIAKAQGILCFEEEAAGLADDFKCIVVRGICDYADSHKNKKWQNYAALVAAAYAKELLSVIPETLVKGMAAIKSSE